MKPDELTDDQVTMVMAAVFAAGGVLLAIAVCFLRRMHQAEQQREQLRQRFEVKLNTGESPVPRKEMNDLPDRRLD